MPLCGVWRQPKIPNYLCWNAGTLVHVYLLLKINYVKIFFEIYNMIYINYYKAI